MSQQLDKLIVNHNGDTFELKSPNLQQIISDIARLNSVAFSSYNKEIILNDENIIASGTYDLLDNADNFDMKVVTFAKSFLSVKDTISSTVGYTIVPPLSSKVTDNFVITSSGDYNSTIYSAYRPFDGNALSSGNGWHNSTNSFAWIQIQKLDGPFRTDMFTLYWDTNQKLHPLSIKGSNDGVEWTTLITDEVYNNTTRAVNYKLPAHVEYSYIRLEGNTSRTPNRRCYLYEMLIQDSDIHGMRDRLTEITSTNNINSPDYGEVSFNQNQMDVTLLNDYTILSVIGLLYNKILKYPIGIQVGWSFDTLPEGFLWCNAQPVPDTYPDLKALMPVTPNKPGYIIQAVSGIAEESLNTTNVSIEEHNTLRAELEAMQIEVTTLRGQVLSLQNSILDSSDLPGGIEDLPNPPGPELP